jgi:hypothetical protein
MGGHMTLFIVGVAAFVVIWVALEWLANTRSL